MSPKRSLGRVLSHQKYRLPLVAPTPESPSLPPPPKGGKRTNMRRLGRTLYAQERRSSTRLDGS